MPAAVAFFDSDGTTPLASVFYGLIPPGSSYFERNSAYRQIIIKNVGDAALEAVLVTIIPAGDRDASANVRIATGADPQPEDFKSAADGPLDLGALAVDATASLWVDIIEPAEAALTQGKGWTFQVAGVPAEES